MIDFCEWSIIDQVFFACLELRPGATSMNPSGRVQAAMPNQCAGVIVGSPYVRKDPCTEPLMNLSRLVFALPFALVASAAAAPAQTGTVVPVGPFQGIGLNGGGHVVLKHGAVQRVVLLKGSTQYTRITIEHGKSLQIDACNERCPNNYDLEIEITTPDVSALAVNGGGEIEARAGFPHQRELAVAVHGGGDIDLRAIAADSVSAAVHGGGDISVHADKTLNAAVNGGGDVTYWGHPEVNSAIRGGGDVSSGS
jgi:hypothetical protein